MAMDSEPRFAAAKYAIVALAKPGDPKSLRTAPANASAAVVVAPNTPLAFGTIEKPNTPLPTGSALVTPSAPGSALVTLSVGAGSV